MSEGFVKLWSSILDSSIWCLDNDTRLVWITMLAMADADGMVHASIPGIANRARVSVEAAEKAIEIFQTPDQHSRSIEFDGRRVERVNRDWKILNFIEHRRRQVEENERARKRDWWRKNRSKTSTSDETSETSERLDKTSSIHIQKHITYTDNVSSRDLPPPDHDPKLNYCPTKQPLTSKACRSIAEYSAEFENFWSAYPKKVGKRHAWKAWKMAKGRMPDIANLLAAINRQRDSESWRDGYIPNPATWLNGDRWLDEGSEIPQKPRPKFLNEEN